MADDVAMPSNPLVVAVDRDKLEEATLDGTLFDEVALEVNVSQRLRGPINPLPMEHQAEYLARTICRILDFLQL
jgi:hypothetical protein